MGLRACSTYFTCIVNAGRTKGVELKMTAWSSGQRLGWKKQHGEIVPGWCGSTRVGQASRMGTLIGERS
jgi:hypothetical protein